MTNRLLFFILSLVLIFNIAATTMQAENGGGVVDTNFAPVLDAFPTSVYALAKQPDGKILVGGYFTAANFQPVYNLARFNADGTFDSSFYSNVSVYGNGLRSIAVQPDGKILIGGNFFHPSTFNTTSILRLNPNGSFDSSFTATANGTVTEIKVLSDGKILMGGSFLTVNGQIRSRIARLNTNGTTDTTFSHSAAQIDSMAIQPDGKIVISEVIANTDSTTTLKISRININGGLDGNFSAVTATGINYRARSLKLQPDGKIVFGGNFFQINGFNCTHLARLNTDGSIDASLSSNITTTQSPAIASLDLDESGRILIGGNFQSINGGGAGRIARLNADGSTDSSFATEAGANETVYVVRAEEGSGGRALFGGDFQQYQGAPRYRFARLNANGGIDAGFSSQINTYGKVIDIETQPADNKFIIAGDFTFADGRKHGGIARFLPDGSLDTSFADFNQSQFYGFPINDIDILSNGKIAVTGEMYFNSSPTAYAAIRLNSNGTYDSSFVPPVLGSNAPRKIKALPNGQILLSGDALSINGVTRYGLVRLNSNGTLDNSFNPVFGSDGTPLISNFIIRTDGKILVTGYFNSVNGTARVNFALLNADGSLDAAFSPNISSGNVSLVKQLRNGNILISGTFTSINSVSRNRIAVLTPSGDLVSSFNPGNIGANNTITAISEYVDGRIIFAGFSSASSINFVVLNQDGSLNGSIGQTGLFNNSVYDIEVQSDGRVIAGGAFTKIAGSPRFGLARLNSIEFSKKAIFDFDGDGKTDISIFRPSAGQWWYSRSSDGGNYAAQFGQSTDKLTPGDYTGDGKTDIALFRPSSGEWFVLRSEDGSFYSFAYGTNGDIPAVGDFDSDNKADNAVFRPSTATWYIRRSSDGGTTIQTFGQTGDVPVVADYDGDGKADIAIYRVSAGEWWINRSTNGLIAFQFGNSTDKPVQGDYTGDGKADVALFRPSTGEWFVLRSENQSYYSFPFGTNGDTPAPGDYDGDGKFDATVFRPSNNTWYSNRSSSTTLIQSFGQSGDVPVPNVFVP